MIYRLSRRLKSNQNGEWLSSTKGELPYVLTVLELNLTSPELIDYEYKITREG